MFSRLSRIYIVGGTLLAMINCLHSNQARLLIAAAAVSVTHPTHFLTTRLILSAKLSKNEIISSIIKYISIQTRRL